MPHRIWTYFKDVSSFYEKLIKKIEEEKEIPEVLHCAGNGEDKIVSNVELMEIIA